MQRYHQTVDQLLESLSPIETSWKDAHAHSVIAALIAIPDKKVYGKADVEVLLEQDFEAGRTVLRLILDMSKDEFELALKPLLGAGGSGAAAYKKDKAAYIAAIEQLGILSRIGALTGTPVTWREILVERLKSGRGSAIKGQARGRSLENFTEAIVKKVFDDVGFDTRCRFVGAGGTSTEKADFAIPSKADPGILIEVKAYGATGSKQTDILGDIARIAEQKRNDTHLLLVTDGSSWEGRANDLRKLVALQNKGDIARIYTQRMVGELETDLRQLRQDHAL